MEVTEAQAGNALTLRIVGRVDSSVSNLLDQKVRDVVARDCPIVVDLGDMDYVSSAGLRCFVVLAKHARARNRTIALCGMREEITEIFQLSGLLRLFPVYDNVETAVATLPQ
jgi:anti-anti-sigma factor